jgi:hypothetical protein
MTPEERRMFLSGFGFGMFVSLIIAFVVFALNGMR